MFDEKEKEDLELLIDLGKKQAGKLSSMIVTNYFVGFPSVKQTENTVSYTHLTLPTKLEV